jgi:4,4'-diaponeurosporenoate glycosyltransferase
LGRASSAIRAAGWLAGMWLLAELPLPRAGEGGDAGLSVIVPARNEESSLPHLLDSLAVQTLRPLEVIVVDDHSSDRTALVAAHAGARVVPGADLPEGWTGKTWACHQGAQVAAGEVLVFLDADVRLAPAALALLAAEHHRHGGLVSVQPCHVVERPYERLSAVANVASLMGTGAFTGPPRRQPAMAFGPCLAIGAGDYGRVGGHAHPAVRPLVTEDIGLARRCRQEGVAVRLLVGGEAVQFRMYPGGLVSLVEGWTKGLAYGARHSPAPAGVLTALWVTGAALGAADGLGALRRRPGVGALWYGAWVAQMGWHFRRVGRFGWATAALYPAPLAAFMALTARSALRRVAGRPPRWRGRTAPLS